MKRFGLMAAVTAAALVGAGLVGGAGAQLPTGDTPPTKTVTVNGVGYGGNVSKKSTLPSRKATYKLALERAMDDARSKADAIAAKAGVSVSSVNSVSEEGSAATCGSPRTKTSCAMNAGVTVEYTIQ
jgi:uncharacterized protein YggE